MDRIFIIGYMGAGKTTIGRALSEKLNYQFLDLDLFIENRQHKTLNDIFKEFGEPYFRKLESKVLREVSEFEHVVISVGGGTPCFNDNLEFMNSCGVTVYLRADAEELCRRLELCKNSRPLIKNKSSEELLPFIKESLSFREPYYNKAHIIIATGSLLNKEDVSDVVKKTELVLFPKIESNEDCT